MNYPDEWRSQPSTIEFKRLFFLSRTVLFSLILLSPFSQSSVRSDGLEELPKGTVVEKVVCQAHPGESYALFLPSNYSADKRWPILYAFDPGARGKVPVTLFKDAAERYGYIVVGSNNSRNSEPAGAIINNLLLDTQARFSIDERRVYATGFSGGARLACLLGAKSGGSIAGVIACSGGFPSGISPGQSTPFVLFGTAGTEDFNFQEMKQLNKTLDSIGVPNTLMIFEGGHDWLPQELAGQALEWLEIQGMKAGRREKNDSLIDGLLKREIEGANALNTAGKVYAAYVAYESLVNEFKGLRDVSEYEKTVEQLKNHKEVKEAFKNEEKEKSKERDLTEHLVDLIGKLKDSDDAFSATASFKSAIANLRKESDARIDTGERRVARRVLQQLLIGFYEQATLLYKQKNYLAMSGRLELALEIRPNDPRILYNLAVAYALNGRKRKALDTLKTAVSNGFADLAKLKADNDLSTLRDEPDLEKIIQSMDRK